MTPVKKDQDHCQILAYFNPQIPDRTAAILANGEDPITELVKTASILERAGASYLSMPCNTAHYYYKEIQEQINIPLINMIDETVEKICTVLPGVNKVGLLATEGTVQSKIYDQSFLKYKVKVIVPGKKERMLVMKAIYAFKAGNVDIDHKKVLQEISKKLIEKGAEAVILGCTELPLLIKEEDCNFPVFIPQKILAEKLVSLCKN